MIYYVDTTLVSIEEGIVKTLPNKMATLHFEWKKK